MSDPTDAELIAQVLQDGNKDAFGGLVFRYQSPLRWLLRKLTCGDVALADDLAQDTFVRAFLHIKDFRGDARFSTWLYRIAYNAFLGEKRKNRKHVAPRTVENDFRESNPPNTLLQMDLEKALSSLHEAERAALLLAYSKDCSHQEIARVLDCPVGTVKTHILRGKEKLRSQLRGWEGKVEHG